MIVVARDAATASWSGAGSASPAAARDAATASWFFVRATSAVVFQLRLNTGAVIPLSEIQCRRRVGASTWLSARVPTWSLALETSLVSAIGATLIVDTGDGESWAEFLSAVLTDVASDARPGAASIELTGRVQTPRWRPATRVLSGVQRRGSDSGRRSCRCSVDTLLRPNDTVDDGVSSWLAGSITYRIGARESWMEVQERG